MNLDTTSYIESLCQPHGILRGDDNFNPNLTVGQIKELIRGMASHSQPAHISVEDLCKQLEEANPYKDSVSLIGANAAIKWCSNKFRELLSGNIITTEQAISDVWRDAICYHIEQMTVPIDDRKYLDLPTYLKEKFNTTSQPVKSNEDVSDLGVYENYQKATSVKGEEQEKDLGTCVECKREPATVDYNGHGHYVCQICYKHLTNEFEDEYK